MALSSKQAEKLGEKELDLANIALALAMLTFGSIISDSEEKQIAMPLLGHKL